MTNYLPLLKAGISFALGIAGLIYIKNMPNNQRNEYNPLIKKIDGIEIRDSNRDSIADVVQIYPEFSQKHNINPEKFISPNIKEYIKINESFFDMFGTAKPLSYDLQNLATSALYGQKQKELEQKVISLLKKKE
ncbi:hypothetical protein HYS72_03000 [Candidatus Pacearchaeota archaeon]|nr:hypothetical protein [Candidatus Pacearchaeota archaeon]MBI2056825.1 hypothetical protein [Candidatus Pacearchaeota archaeon]